MTFLEEVQRRRTFAIISHPDAGKTTLTEKLLLYGGAIHLAGKIQKDRQACRVRLDGNRKTARYLCNEFRITIRLRRLSRQHPRYTRSPGLFGGYVSHINGRRQCSHAHRRRKRRRSPNKETICRI